MRTLKRKAILFALRKLLPHRWGRRLLWKAARTAASYELGRVEPDGDPHEQIMRRYLLYFMLPLWFAPGVLDWVMHRRTRIAETSGTEESLIHSLMMTEVGVPILAGLLLEINAGALLLMIAAFFVHWATAFWDVAYATGRREVRPNEQHIHSFLEVLPFCAVSFVACLHWEQFLALFGQGPEEARFALRLKRPPLSPRYIVGILGAIALLIALPYGEELWRCWRAEKDGRMPSENRVFTA